MILPEIIKIDGCFLGNCWVFLGVFIVGSHCQTILDTITTVCVHRQATKINAFICIMHWQIHTHFGSQRPNSHHLVWHHKRKEACLPWQIVRLLGGVQGCLGMMCLGFCGEWQLTIFEQEADSWWCDSFKVSLFGNLHIFAWSFLYFFIRTNLELLFLNYILFCIALL